MSVPLSSQTLPKCSQVSPIPANRMALEWRLEWLLSIGIEIKRKASIVFDDGRKRSKIGKPYVGLIMEIFEEVQVQNKKKNTSKLFSVKKASGIRITGSLHSKSLDKAGKKAKKMVGPAGFEPATK